MGRRVPLNSPGRTRKCAHGDERGRRRNRTVDDPAVRVECCDGAPEEGCFVASAQRIDEVLAARAGGHGGQRFARHGGSRERKDAVGEAMLWVHDVHTSPRRPR